MAVTRLRRIKETSGKNPAAHLKKNIFYICNPAKTQGGIYIGGNAGVSPETIYRTMTRNKEYWQKTDKAQAYHYMLCFPPDCGVNEDLAYQIAKEFCKELLKDDYYYVFAVHNDKPHMHVHITFDSVSRRDGYKFHSPKGDWKKRIQPITDRLCEKYHLPTLNYEDKERTGMHYGDWKKWWEPKEVYYDWNDIIRDDIDEAIQHSDSMEELLQYLHNQKYVIRNGKYLSLRPYGRPRSIRTGRLGPGYTKEEIQQRIQDKKLEPDIQVRYKTYGNREEIRQIIYAKIQRTPGWKMNSMQKQFFRRWNNTYFIRKPDRYRQVWKYKSDILEVQNLADALNYLITYDIQNEQMLFERQRKVQEETDALQLKIRVLQTGVRRKNADKNGIKAELSKLRKVLGDSKKELELIGKTRELFYSCEDPEMAQENPERKQEDERNMPSNAGLTVSEKEGRKIKKDGKQDEPDNKNYLGEKYR